jgi:hypothetical protein
MPMMPQTPEERKRIADMQAQATAVQPAAPNPSGIMPGRIQPPAPADDIFGDVVLSSDPRFKAQEAAAPAALPAEQVDTAEQFTAPSQAPAPATADNSSMAAPSVMQVPVTSTSQSVTSTSIPKEQEGALKESQVKLSEQENELLKLNTEVAKKSAQEQAANTAKAELELTALKKKQEDLDKLRVANLEKYAQKAKDYEGMSITNPWSNMSTGSKIMAALSIALGGLADGSSPNPTGSNVALDVINNAMARDIDIQKANMDKKKGELTAIQKYGEDLRQMGVDEANIKEAMLALGEKQLANKLEGIKNQLSPEDPRSLQVEQLKNTFAQKAFDRQKQVAEMYAQKATTQTETGIKVMELGGKSAAIKPPSDTVLKDLRAKEDSLKSYESLEKFPTENMGPIIGRFKTAFKNWLPDKSFAAQDTEVQKNVITTLKAVTGSQMTDAEYERLAGLLPSMTNDPVVFKQKVKVLKDEAARSFDTDLQTYKNYYDVSPFIQRRQDTSKPASLKKSEQ